MAKKKKTKLPTVHPGEVLEEEFLKPLGITRYRIAKDIGVTPTRIGEICDGKRAVTADSSLRLAQYFNTTARFWMNLQQLFDMRKHLNKHAEEIASIERCPALSQ